MSGLQQVNDQNFENEVIKAGMPVLVDFWAPWCGPCRMLGPTMEELAKLYEGRVKVVKLNTDESQAVAGALGIRSIPTVILFDGAKVVSALVGARPKAAFVELLEQHLKASAQVVQAQRVPQIAAL